MYRGLRLHCLKRHPHREIAGNILKVSFQWNHVDTKHNCPDLTSEKPLHVPAMAKEVIESLQPQSGQLLIDMTFGAGGHTRKILETAPNAKVLVLDRDPFAFSLAQNLARDFPNQVVPLLGRFSELPELLSSLNISQNSIDGMLFDFGCSSMQFDRKNRGFSLSKNGPLDMRMDGNRFPDTPTAADVLARADEEDIIKILKVYGEEKRAKQIARAVIEARYLFKKLETTHELAQLVATVFDDTYKKDKLERPAHVATKTFQALRIFVNNELNEINYGIILAGAYLKVGGRLVTLTFHSLEDVIVKRHLSGNIVDSVANPLPLQYTDPSYFHDEETLTNIQESNWTPIHKHVLTPTAEEVESNPRVRSAKLRAAIKKF